MRGYLAGYRVSPTLAFRVWQRELTLYRRIWPSTILSTLFDPILYLLAMGFGLGAYIADIGGVPYAQFIGPGLVATAVMTGAAYEAAWNSWVRIFSERSYEAMMSTPAELEDVVAWGATRATIASVVMLAVLLGFGLVRSWWALLVPLVAVVGGVMFTTLGLAYTVRCRHMDQLTFLFTLGVTPMYLFSGVFFPLDGFPGWVGRLAWLSPLHHLVEVVRGLALGDVGGWMLPHVGVMVGLTLACWGLPSLALRARLKA